MYCIFFKTAKLAFLALTFIAYIEQANAQEKRVLDSLYNVLKSVKDDKELMKVKVELGWYFLKLNDEEALKHSTEGYRLALQFGDSANIVKGGRIMGQAFRRLDRLQESITSLKEVLPIAVRNKFGDEQKKILNALAVAYTFRAQYDKALDYHFQSLILREQEGNKADISVSLSNIGLVYFKLHNYEGALKYYNESLLLKEEVKDTVDLNMLYLNLGLCYLQLKQFSDAKEFTLRGLEICDNCSEEIRIMGEYGLGEASFHLNDLADADLHLNKSLRIAREASDMRWQAENLAYLGASAWKQKKYDDAVTILSEAESIAKKGDYNQILIDIYKSLIKVYSEQNDYKNASLFQDKLIRQSELFIGQDLVKNIAKIQADYEERKNIATIASKEVVISQQRDLNVAIAVIAMLAGLLVLVLQFGNRNIKRVNAKLSEAKEVIQKQNSELENKNRELDIEVDKKTVDLARVNQSLKQVNDELDNFIYKTSHDIRGPLASLKGMCNVALLDVKDPIALDYLRKLDATAERLNSILTRLVIINQINNSKLTVEAIDFKAIVHDVLMLEKKKGLPPELKITTYIDPDAEMESDKELVRIVLENLIDNAIKFYNDSDRVDSFMKVHISSVDGNAIKVRVIDNGIGISESSPGKLFQMFSRASERSETGGIGLYITKTATEKIGGRVGLLTTPEGHTEFYVIFPKTPYYEVHKLERRLG
ncbi:MAG: tetratricopeptide repeat-containing sensor histidine kinase [Chryseolinea sp.]